MEKAQKDNRLKPTEEYKAQKVETLCISSRRYQYVLIKDCSEHVVREVPEMLVLDGDDQLCGLCVGSNPPVH